MSSNDQILFTGRAYRDHYAFWKKQLSVIDDGFFFPRRPGESSW